MCFSDINQTMLIYFVLLFNITRLRAKYSSVELPVNRFSGWVEIAAVPAEKDIMERMVFSDLRRQLALKDSQFQTGRNLALCRFGSVQIFRVFRALPAIYTYVMKDARIGYFF